MGQSVEKETSLAAEASCVGQLARFFPRVERTHMRVQITALRPGSTALRESAVLEFCDASHAIFVSALPLEFNDRVRLERDQRGAGATDAFVVAVQYHEGRKAVAIRFLGGPGNRVMQT